MRRREFVLSAAGVLTLLRPLPTLAAEGRPRIGILDISSAEYSGPNLAAFREGLQHLGYVEGRTVEMDYRSANGDAALLQPLAQELIKLKPNVMLAVAVSPTLAIKRIAPSLPIVTPGFSDAFVPALAESFAHPGGSVTGVATDVEGMVGKLTELALDAVPGSTRIGFLANPAGGSMKRFEQQVQSVAKARGVDIEIVEVAKLTELDDAFARFADRKVQAVIVPANGMLHAGQKRIVALANAKRLPSVFSEHLAVLAGGFASYGVDSTENYRRAAAYVDRILKGAAPGDLPIEFPSRLKLVISMKTAKALGLTVPNTLLDRADEVIE
jgi:putative ABC transport system substrate-binding protein